MSLSIDPGTGEATVTHDNGSHAVFEPDGSGGFTPGLGVYASLLHNADGTYAYVLRNRETYTFSASGLLLSRSDLDGNTTAYEYSGAQVTSISDGAGRSIVLSYDGSGHVSSVTDPLGRETTYGYDGSGNLVSSTDPAGHTTTLGYDGNHLLTAMTSPDGGTTTTGYDSDGRAVTQTDAMGRTTTWAYAGDAFSDAGGTTTITEPDGEVKVEQYLDGALMQLTHNAGTASAASWQYGIDFTTGATLSVTDPDGHTSSQAYDAAGNVTSVTDPDGRTTSSTYDALGDALTKTDAVGVTTTYTYTASGDVLATSTPVGGGTVTTSNTYGDATHPGDVTGSTDADGHTTSYGYDTYGDVASVRDPDGNTTTATFDADGEKLTSVAPNGNVVGCGCASHYTTRYDYDANGALASVTDPLGHTTGYGYDATGNQTSVTDPTGLTTATVYDADNEQTGVTNPDGTSTSYGYDVDGHRTSVKKGTNPATVSTYDVLGDVLTVTDPLGHETVNSYDAAGRLTSTTGPNGGVTAYSYDAAGQLLSMTSPTGGVTAYSYDADGRKVTVTDADGHITGYGYDGLGRLVSTTNPDGTVVTNSYDNAGQLLTYTQPTAASSPAQPLPGGGGPDPAPAPSQTQAAPGLSDPYPAAVLADGPSVFYRLDDPAGSTDAADSSGNGNTASVDSAGVSFSQAGALPNETDTAAAFAGGLVRETSGTGLPTGNGDRSVEAWFKTTSTGHQILTWWGTQATDEEMEVGTDAGHQIYLTGQYDDARFTTPYSIADSNWHHLVVTYTGSTKIVTAYLDGQSIGAQVLPTALNTTLDATGLTVGGPQCDCYTFTGSLNDVAIYPSALSAAQVAGHYAASGYPTPAAPDAPGNLQTSVGTNEVAVGWTAAATGSPVDHYLISANVNNGHTGASIAVAGDVTSTVLSGLAGGVPATVRVVAVNADGTSAAATSASLTPAGLAAGYAQQVLTDTPSLFYRLDEAGTQTIADSSGHDHDATNTVEQGLGLGAAGPIGGDGATAASTGSGEAQEASGAGLPTGNADRSIEAWFKTTNTGHQVITWWGTDAPDQEMELGTDNGDQIYLTGEYNEARFTTPASFADGSWHHLVLTYGGSSRVVTAYLDGAAVGSHTLGDVWNTTLDSTGLVIGGPQYHGYYFSGNLADVAIYATALSADQVRIHYRAGTFGGVATTSYAYDAAGRETSVTDPDGRVTSYGYDADGNQTALTDALGRTATSSFDPLGELIAITYSDHTTHAVGYGYDAAGRRTSMSDGTGTSSYTYDPFGRLVSVTDGAGQVTGYSYDSLGRIASITYPDGLVVSRGYNADSQLASVDDGQGNTISFGYDGDGNHTTTTYPGGVTDTSTFDASDRLTAITIANAATALASFGYTLTPGGLVSDSSDSLNPTGPSTYGYDPTNRLTAVSAATYGYDTTGALTALPDGSIQGVDPSGQLTTRTNPDGSTVTYSYDGVGERTAATPSGSSAASTFGYDQAGQLTAAAAAAGSATYTYDGDGLRASATTAGATSRFAWDRLTVDLPLLLSDGTNDYIYGPDNTVVEQTPVAGGTPDFTHADRLGTTRVLTDPTGASVATYSYDAYGNRTAHTGTASTPFGYTGQYTDPTGLIYLRARYYDPTTEQFLTVDPMVDTTRSPYGYTAGNPLNATDPTGLHGAAVNPFSSNFWTKGNIFSDPVQKNLACGNGLYDSLVMAYDPVYGGLQTYSSARDQGNSITASLIMGFDPAYGGIAHGAAAVDDINHGRYAAAAGEATQSALDTAATVALATGVGTGWGAATATAESESAWFQVTKAGANRAGTHVPESFDLSVAGERFSVVPNATKHMAEYATGTGSGSIPMSSFAGAVETAVKQGLRPGRNFIQIGPWELGIDTTDNVIYHALYRP